MSYENSIEAKVVTALTVFCMGGCALAGVGLAVCAVMFGLGY